MRYSKKKKLKKFIIIGLFLVILYYFVNNWTQLKTWATSNDFFKITGTIKKVASSGNAKEVKDGLFVLKSIVKEYEEKKHSALAQSSVMDLSALPIECPSVIKDHQVVQHTGKILSFNARYKVPDWVAYTITAEHLNSSVTSRTEDFREDPQVLNGPTLEDYRGSGYDRGHLLPAASVKHSQQAMSDSFILSGIVPQINRYNAGIWLDAESAERDTARQYGTLYAVSGPVLTDGPFKTIGESAVAVPKSCYKAFLIQAKDNSWRSIALVIPQEGYENSLKPYWTSVNKAEEITGLDFFPALPDVIEDAVEEQCDLNQWPKSFVR